MSNIIISTKRDDNLSNFVHTSTDLKKLKMNELRDIIKKYGINEVHERRLLKLDLIFGIIKHEELSAGGKQTELNLNVNGFSKSYFIETKNNLIQIKKHKVKKYGVKTVDNLEFYYIFNYLFIDWESEGQKLIIENENENDKTRFIITDCICKDRLSLFDDMRRCHKAICFIESLNLFLKVKSLLPLFDNNNDIVINICNVYFKISLRNVSNIRCKLQL